MVIPKFPHNRELSTRFWLYVEITDEEILFIMPIFKFHLSEISEYVNYNPIFFTLSEAARRSAPLRGVAQLIRRVESLKKRPSLRFKFIATEKNFHCRTL